MDSSVAPSIPLVESGLAATENTNFWPVLFLILGIIIILVIAKKLIKKFAAENSNIDQMIFLVRMPKEKPKEERIYNTESNVISTSNVHLIKLPM